VTIRKAVTVVDGQMVVCNPAVHLRADGVCAGVDGSIGLLRFRGTQAGYSSLTTGYSMYVGSNGDLVEDPDDSLNVLLVGYAESSTAIGVACAEVL